MGASVRTQDDRLMYDGSRCTRAAVPAVAEGVALVGHRARHSSIIGQNSASTEARCARSGRKS
jgi:hypothetical protein